MRVMQSIVIYGAGGHGRVIIEVIRSRGINVVAVFDDHPQTTELLGVPVQRPPKKFLPIPLVVAIGSNTLRKAVFERLAVAAEISSAIVHPFTSISSTATLGRGTMICAGVVVNTLSQINEDCILNTACSVDHDCKIGSHVHIGPGARLAGGVSIGDESFIGMGSVILPGITIGSRVIVGAGSVVTRNLPDGVTAFGVPAKIKDRVPLN